MRLCPTGRCQGVLVVWAWGNLAECTLTDEAALPSHEQLIITQTWRELDAWSTAALSHDVCLLHVGGQRSRGLGQRLHAFSEWRVGGFWEAAGSLSKWLNFTQYHEKTLTDSKKSKCMQQASNQTLFMDTSLIFIYYQISWNIALCSKFSSHLKI